MIAPLKKDSVFWHSVWISAGRPMGALHQVMCNSRTKYHCAVKQAKRNVAHAKAMELLAAAESGDAALMEEMRKTITKKNTAQGVPDCLEGKVTHDSILDKFKDCYKDLYNSAGTSAAMVDIKKRLEQLINVSSAGEVAKITGEVVKLA